MYKERDEEEQLNQGRRGEEEKKQSRSLDQAILARGKTLRL